ncbi:uncharacterized protein LOC143922051 [Arctopsyche grandis]|uniref:uncharacterized protein LOC143922051 n=1 Tax=Arctopsyche grandis TaxID=121162 RepID=UPI00406D9B99
MNTDKRDDILFLFDVDGTLTPSRERVTPEVLNALYNLREKVTIGFVGGSDLSKQQEQIGDNVLSIFDYGFPENGLQYYQGNHLIESQSFVKFLTEPNYCILVNAILLILSKITIPCKRGNFVELRESILNISPIGRSCSREERAEFLAFDNEHKIREEIAKEIDDLFGKSLGIRCAIGGQISIDIFPKGWDKTYCLKFIKQKKIFFFGDKTEQGGNDYELFNHPAVIGVKVKDPQDTIKKINEKLQELGIQTI